MSLNQVGSNKRRGAWPRPVHLALTQPDGIDGVTADLQNQSSVHNIEKLGGEQLLLLIGDMLRTWELDLLQADRAKELLLVGHRTQVPVEEPAALGVAHGQRLPTLLPTVLKLDVQVSHCKVREDSEGPALLLCPLISPRLMQVYRDQATFQPAFRKATAIAILPAIKGDIDITLAYSLKRLF